MWDYIHTSSRPSLTVPHSLEQNTFGHKSQTFTASIIVSYVNSFSETCS